MQAPFIWHVATAIGLSLATMLPAQAGLINGNFETTLVTVPNDSYIITNESNVPGWHTTSTDHQIEIWDDGFTGFSYPGFPIQAYEGKQFAEINATQHATLYQDSIGIVAGAQLDFYFAHRGRSGVDTMLLTITDLGTDGILGSGDDTVLFSKEYSSGNQAWSFYTSAAEVPIIALGNTVRFGYGSVSTASGSPTIGNFIDAVDFGVGVLPAVPEPQTWALMLAGLGFMLHRSSRGRRTEPSSKK